MTSSSLYQWLGFGRRALLYAIQNHPDAKVIPPTDDEIDLFIRAIEGQYHLLGEERVWAACDGLKLPLQQSKNWYVQNPNYNGWLGHTYVNSIFLFAPDGKIRICTINCPGSWHDSTQADYGVYNKLERIYNRTGGKIVVDSALFALEYLLT